MKILNLYSGIGGNRKLWGDEHEVVAIENNEEIARAYKTFFPNDKVIVDDAHQYLLDNFKEFDFIWSSPPCQSHSRTNNFLHAQGVVRYPDMQLYEEIIFLRQWGKNIKWVVENVVGYYKPLIEAKKVGRHLFWANFGPEMDPKIAPTLDKNLRVFWFILGLFLFDLLELFGCLLGAFLCFPRFFWEDFRFENPEESLVF